MNKKKSKKKKRPTAGRPPMDANVVRSELVKIRCSKPEKQQIEANAGEQDVSTWAREKLLKGD